MRGSLKFVLKRLELEALQPCLKRRNPICSSQKSTMFLLSNVTKLPKFVPIKNVNFKFITDYDVPATGTFLLFFNLFLNVLSHVLEVLKFTVVLHF